MTRRDDLIRPLFDFAMRELRETIAAGESVNRHTLTMYFEAATLADRGTELAELTAIAEALPPYDPLAGAIHNFDPREAVRSVRYRPPTRAQIDAAHPVHDPAALLRTAPEEAAEAIRLLLAGHPEEALASARNEYELELAVAARALLRDFAGAAASLERLPPNRTFGPYMALLTEAFQAANEPVLLRMVAEVAERFGTDGCLMAVVALAGRVPWLGYPFPDW
jgi:hypothetical protein